MRLRAKAVEALVESVRQAMPRSVRYRSISGAIDVEQRPDDAIAGDRPDAGQPGGPRAAQETEKDGFGLIGAGVAGGHPVDGAGLR